MLQKSSGAELATDQRRIVQLLKSLVQSRALLTVLVPARKGTYTSALIDINPEKRLIKLDEFVPRIDPGIFAENGRMSAHSKLHGIPVHFETHFRQAGTRDGYEFLICDMPRELVYDQKRKHFRLARLGGNAPTIELTVNDEVVIATVQDISAGGAKLKLKNGVNFETGDVIESSRIQFKDGTAYNTASQVCAINEKARTMGVKFTTLAHQDMRELQNWIMETDRKNLRRNYLSTGSMAIT